MSILKRVSIAVLSCLLMLSFVACDPVDKEYGNESETESVSDTVNEKVKEDEDVPIMSSDRVMSNFFDISLFDEENYSDIYLGKKFKIDALFLGKELKVPTTLEEMESKGWVLAEGNEYDSNALVFAYETINAVFVNSDGVTLKAQFYNSSRSSVKLSECYIVKFRIENDFYTDNIGYNSFNVNGIINTMAVTDIIDNLGTPSHFYQVSENAYYLDYFITKKDRRNGITVYINPVDDLITAIEFSYYK